MAPRPTTPAQVSRVLILDDEEAIRHALTRFFRARGYVVSAVDSGDAALSILTRLPHTLLLCDVRLPGMNGMEVLRGALAADPDLAVVMLTAVNDALTATEAMAHGAADYLVKPIELDDLLHAVEGAIHRRGLAVERRRVEQVVRDEVAIRTAELEREKQALRSLTVNIAETLINAMEAKDLYLRGHSQRVSELGASIASTLELDEDVVEKVRLAGRLHDVGKIGIRETVLNKPGPLTPEEFEHVKDHVRIGMEILAPLKHLGAILDFVHDHHEHFDGSGYPRGRSGHAISLGGRILLAADAYDALTSQRAYRQPISSADTLAYLDSQSGRLVDPLVLEALRQVVVRNQSLTFIE